MNKCFLCDATDNLWYCYPIPGGGTTVGAKLCLEHRTIMERTPQEFRKLLSDRAIKEKKGGK